MFPTGKDVYQFRATPLRLVGKNLQSNAWFVVYNNIKFLYATMCSSGQVFPSKEFMLGTLILAGLGVAKILVDKGEFSNIGASWGPPMLKYC